MNRTHNPQLSGIARRLRREMTKEEKRLWYDCLKSLPVQVHRQKVLGPYVVDFYVASAKIVIEVDGMQHGEEDMLQKDAARDVYLQERGICVLRYANERVHHAFRDVCEDIWNHIQARTE